MNAKSTGKKMNVIFAENHLQKKRIRRDHCHITGKFRGAAHNKCNLHFRFKPLIPVVIHGLKGYDSHLMQAIGKVSGDVNCIPNNMKKYISFSFGSLRFIDSEQFLLAPLDKLVKAQDKEDLKITKKYGGENWEILTKKGIYPYEYMDIWEKINKTSLPSQEKFCSILNGSGITHEEYMIAKSTWKIF